MPWCIMCTARTAPSKQIQAHIKPELFNQVLSVPGQHCQANQHWSYSNIVGGRVGAPN